MLRQRQDDRAPGGAGYHNAVPFLDKSIVDTSDGHVQPLFQHMLHPQFGASLSFVGLPATVASFHQFELQARLIARLLSGRVPTPSQEEMERWMKAHYRCVAASLPVWYMEQHF